MRSPTIRLLTMLLAVLGFLVAVSAADARTLRVATTGKDSATCGPVLPCRSISRAIGNAVALDTIIVGPGVYGDINHNGVLREAGDELGPPACDCMLWVNKRIVLISTDGAAATVIDARNVNVGRTVVITAGGEFGRAGRGFTVTPTKRDDNVGLMIDADDLAVRGNQVVSASGVFNTFIGIFAQGAGSVLIEGNQAMGWGGSGISVVGSGKTVRRNQVSLNAFGIRGFGDNTITYNIATANAIGVDLWGDITATRNAAYGNSLGFQVNFGFRGTFEENNIFSNVSCGLSNHLSVLLAPHNYWGAATGPGSDPADAICDSTGSTTLFAPVATRPFIVTAPIMP